jgi:hypothetical protein
VGRAAVRALHPGEVGVRDPLSPDAALYPDADAGYEYPDQYFRIFGEDYKPPMHIEATYKMLKNHKWYMEPRLVTVNDLYAFDPNAKVSIDPFTDIIGRHFKQPKEGLGNDNSPSAHMWRTLANPDQPL